MAKRRLFFDEKAMPEDVADVLEAAALLEITEFELFHLAWRRWYGTTLDDHGIERHYLPYMFRHQVPVWVRHLARQVVRAADEETLDPRAFGVPPRPLHPEMAARGLSTCLWLAAITATLLAGAAAVARLVPPGASCYLPPCY